MVVGHTVEEADRRGTWALPPSPKMPQERVRTERYSHSWAGGQALAILSVLLYLLPPPRPSARC